MKKNKLTTSLMIATALMGTGATLTNIGNDTADGTMVLQAANEQKGSVNVTMPLTQAAKDQYRGKANAKVSNTSDGSGKVFAYFQSDSDELTINIEFRAPDGSTASTTLFFTASGTKQARGIDAEGNYYTINVVLTPAVTAPTPEPEVPETPDVPETPEVEVPDLPTDPGNGDGEWEEEIPETPETPEIPEVEVPETPETPEIPEVEVPETPETPEIPEVEVPETPETPETPEVEVPTTPETPETPEVEVPTTPVEDGEDTVIVTPQKRVAVNGVYTVVAGDTLSEIAEDFGISTANLALWNNLTSDLIFVNDTLFIVAQALEETPEADVPNEEVAVPNEEADVPNEEVDVPNEEVDVPNEEVAVSEGNESSETVTETKPESSTQIIGNTTVEIPEVSKGTQESSKYTTQSTDKKEPTKLLQTNIESIGLLGQLGVGLTALGSLSIFKGRKNKK